MIKFFRRIRQQMMNESKFGKYLLYASGEILLVVIGILIAFNVNNWNEQRKSRAIELKYFENLKTDLLADISSLEEMIGISQVKIEAARRQKVDADQHEVTSIYRSIRDFEDLIFVNEFRPNTNTFEEMKNLVTSVRSEMKT